MNQINKKEVLLSKMKYDAALSKNKKAQRGLSFFYHKHSGED